MAAAVEFVADLERFNKALRTLDRELEKSTRRRMSAIARRQRDRIRSDWKKGPSKGGHSARAVVSGTSGLAPTLKLKRGYRPYIGWLVFGGKRPRDRRARAVPPDGLWFYPGVKRARAEAHGEIIEALTDARRQAGL